MKKLFITILTLTLILSYNVFGKTTTLLRLTNNTYITSEHDDWKDPFTYYGTLSINGSDLNLFTKKVKRDFLNGLV